MTKKIIATLLAGAMLTAAGVTAHAAEPTGNPLDGYAVTVYDQTAPCVFAAGKDWPITKWYFFDADHNIIGSISGKDLFAISAQYPEGENWEYWFADVFNDYRGVDETTIVEPTTEDWAWEVIELTNAERKKHGLPPLEVDAELMGLAQIRAEEVSTKYGHERPDGTTVVETHGCDENVGARASAEKQVAGWMNSEGHRHNILLDRYESIEVGCYQKPNGNLYWVQIFAF